MGKASGSIDLRALRKGTAYITEITDNGIFVHDDGDPTTPNTDNAKGVHITSNSVDIIDNGNVASFGLNVRVGKESGEHVTITSGGMDIVDGSVNPKVSVANFGSSVRVGDVNDNHVMISDGGVDIMDGNNSLAKFGTTNNSTTVRVGKSNAPHLSIDGNKITAYGDSSDIYFETGSFGDTIEQIFYTDGIETRYELYHATTIQSVIFRHPSSPDVEVEITSNEYDFYPNIVPSRLDTHATLQSGGILTITYFTFYNRLSGMPIGVGSFTHGDNAVAIGILSTVEGEDNTASGYCSHAEGVNNYAIGKYSHVGGSNSSATGFGTFVHGNSVQATYDYSVAFGIGNEPTNNLFSIGYGSTSGNAFAVDKDGKTVIGSRLYAGGTYTTSIPMFSIEDFHHTLIPVSADGNYTRLLEITKSGYRAVAVTGSEIRDSTTGQDTTKCVMSQLYVYRTSGKDYVYYNIWNPDTSNSANVQIYFGVLYIAESAF